MVLKNFLIQSWPATCGTSKDIEQRSPVLKRTKRRPIATTTTCQTKQLSNRDTKPTTSKNFAMSLLSHDNLPPMEYCDECVIQGNIYTSVAMSQQIRRSQASRSHQKSHRKATVTVKPTSIPCSLTSSPLVSSVAHGEVHLRYQKCHAWLQERYLAYWTAQRTVWNHLSSKPKDYYYQDYHQELRLEGTWQNPLRYECSRYSA